MNRAHVIRLRPTADQAALILEHVYAARHAWNWALQKFNERLEGGEWLSAYDLRRLYNAEKNGALSWSRKYSSVVTGESILSLGAAIRLSRISHHNPPSFKARGVGRYQYKISNQAVNFDGSKIRLPRIGWVRMCEPLRLRGKVSYVVIGRRFGYWNASVSVELDEVPERSLGEGAVGVDLGVRNLVVASDGWRYERSAESVALAGKIQTAKQILGGMVKGSRNYERQQAKISRLAKKIYDRNRHEAHEIGNHLRENYSTVICEDLDMSLNPSDTPYSKAVQRSGIGLRLRVIQWKVEEAGGQFVRVNRWFPSSKTCRHCGNINRSLKVNQYNWQCPSCGVWLDRDLNAAVNIKREGLRKIAARPSG